MGAPSLSSPTCVQDRAPSSSLWAEPKPYPAGSQGPCKSPGQRTGAHWVLDSGLHSKEPQGLCICPSFTLSRGHPWPLPFLLDLLSSPRWFPRPGGRGLSVMETRPGPGSPETRKAEAPRGRGGGRVGGGVGGRAWDREQLEAGLARDGPDPSQAKLHFPAARAKGAPGLDLRAAHSGVLCPPIPPDPFSLASPPPPASPATCPTHLPPPLQFHTLVPQSGLHFLLHCLAPPPAPLTCPLLSCPPCGPPTS